MVKDFIQVVCPGCGLLCDDIKVKVESGKIVSTLHTCARGEWALRNANSGARLTAPLVRKNGKLVKVTFEEALTRAVDVLLKAERPLLWGWSSASVEAQRMGIRLAQCLGGVIDSTSSICHGSSILAGREAGFRTATLGEVKNRADLIVYWGSDPSHSHPRHLSRYTIIPRGMYTQMGYEQKQLMIIDVRKSRTGKVANQLLEIEPNKDYELILAMRMILKGKNVKQKEVAGIPVKTLNQIIQTWKTQQFGVIFVGLGLSMSRGKYRNIEALYKLVQELNEYARFVAIPMAGHYNMVGFNHVSTWLTGQPFGIDLSRGDTYSNPGETTGAEIIAREEFDAMLAIASDPISMMPLSIARKIAEKPLVAINCLENPTTRNADVVFPAAMTGIEAEGTAYRLDSVPIRLKKFIEPCGECKPDEEILSLILEKIGAKH
ncbi:MAG: formylmethanofuran dehydrogenase subunit B [Candidatus Jordarchaeum sp.]|uniref:formylmethanofuran dehydrogenase subunit B n=1 Tax=Candidatus Jordarchaeum sp. TaxID=2823881 RepID=UPI00404A2437